MRINVILKKDDPLVPELCRNGFHWCNKDQRLEGSFKKSSVKDVNFVKLMFGGREVKEVIRDGETQITFVLEEHMKVS